MLHAFFLLLGVTQAQADTRPVFLPEQDVAIDYTISAPGRPDAAYNLQYDSADEKAVITDPVRGLQFLVDLEAGHAQLVVPALHAIVDAPDLSALTQQITSADDARFTPLGPRQYAGLACEAYLVLNGQGTGTACITPGGVILHFEGSDPHGAATVTATSVTYAPQPRQDFSPPGGYSQITLPPGALQQLLGQ